MKIDGCLLEIKTFQIIDPSLSENFSAQVVGEIHKIELSLPNGINYFYAREFNGLPGCHDAGQLIEKIKEKGEINLAFWKDGGPVHDSDRNQLNEPEMMAFESQREEEAECYGPRM